MSTVRCRARDPTSLSDDVSHVWLSGRLRRGLPPPCEENTMRGHAWPEIPESSNECPMSIGHSNFVAQIAGDSRRMPTLSQRNMRDHTWAFGFSSSVCHTQTSRSQIGRSLESNNSTLRPGFAATVHVFRSETG
jgi:hypothetical protein